MTCPHCRRLLVSGASEWADKSAWERLKIRLETYLWGGLVTCGLAGGFTGSLLHGALGVPLELSLGIAFVVCLAIMGALHKGHLQEVAESRMRKPDLSPDKALPALPAWARRIGRRSSAGELLAYAELLEKGLISRSDFDAKKRELM